ncbi:MAG TPA: tetratricopeptide repeat protein, partial [Verrucomicrobiae bacterium]
MLNSHYKSHSRASRWARFLLALLIVIWPLLYNASAQQAENPAETAAFVNASRSFELATYERAEREFAEFVRSFPESTRVPEAILMQAQALLKQKKLAPCIDLLTSNAPKAGVLADQYYYFLGDAYMQSTNYTSAAGSFARLIREFPNSSRLLESSYGEALARYKLSDWEKVIELLRAPESTFQKVARDRANNELVARGYLLLTEALYARQDYKGAEEALRLMPDKDFLPEFKWRRQYELCLVQLAAQHLDEALRNTTNLLAYAAETGQRQFQAESSQLQARILEHLDRLDEAARAYAKNDSDGFPPELRKLALVQVIHLTLTQNKLAEATQKIDAFLILHPNETNSDAALLTLAELHLRQYAASGATKQTTPTASAPAGNLLAQALGELDSLLKNFTNSAFAGKAQLDRGWCLWLQERLPESLAAFKAATELLP